MKKPSLLPPQAYTQETFVEAYAWLQHQPPSIRELARSADDMVSLFKQQQRIRQRTPANSEEFKSDLKSLAQDLKEFEGEEEKEALPPLSALYSPLSTPSPATMPSPAPPQTSLPSPSRKIILDEKTQTSLNIAREQLNLSSHNEALRVLVVLGLEKMKELFPSKT